VSRELRVVDAADMAAVERSLAAALSGDGPAVLPHAGTPGGLPPEVAQRVALVVQTSGSTGRPKRVELSTDALLASAAAAESSLGGPGQWLLALPLTYIAGLNVLVRSITAGTTPVMGEFSEAAARMTHPVRYTSLVPVQLARLMESDPAALQGFDRILLGGQAAPPALLERAAELGLNVTRTYGSSETAGGCVWDGLPIGDTRVRIHDGRVELSGSVLAEGYLGDPERTAAAFVDGWYRTDDTGELIDGALSVTGRVDDVIVSGGVKVSLAEVEAAVRRMPGLASAVVVAAPHAEWGQTPVVVTDIAADLDDVRTAVAHAVGREAAPSRVVVVAGIPVLSSGKPDRLSIAAMVRG
jgi:O-succinylbenzoic acid--CoA ligase